MTTVQQLTTKKSKIPVEILIQLEKEVKLKKQEIELKLEELHKQYEETKNIKEEYPRKHIRYVIKNRIRINTQELKKAEANVIPFQFQTKYKPATGFCYGKCIQFIGACKGNGHIGKLGIDSCRCRNCSCYFPLNTYYFKLQKQLTGKIRCPCCNRKVVMVARTNLRKIRVEELEAEGRIRRI